MSRWRWGAIARMRQRAPGASGAGPASSPPPGSADERLSDIEKRLDPAMLAAALSQDARARGL